MLIQCNTDHNIRGSEALSAHVDSVVRADLGTLADRITRVEVHLSDQGGRDHADMRCMMEARMEGRQPIAISHQSDSVHQAVAGAGKKLERVVASVLKGRLSRKRSPNSGEPSLSGGYVQES